MAAPGRSNLAADPAEDFRNQFAGQAAPKLPTGDPRIGVAIAGDQEADAYRSVHIPEEWERDQRRDELFRGIGRMVSGVAAAALGNAARTRRPRRS